MAFLIPLVVPTIVSYLSDFFQNSAPELSNNEQAMYDNSTYFQDDFQDDYEYGMDGY